MSNGYTQKTGYTVQETRKRPKPQQMNPGGMPTYQQKPAPDKDPGPWASSESARVTRGQAKSNEMPPEYNIDAKNGFGSNPGSGTTQQELDRGWCKDPLEPWEPQYTNEPAYGGYLNFTGEPEDSGGFVERNNYLDRL